MAKYQHFEELPVWQEASRLYNAVLDLLEEHTLPFTAAFKSQLERAALSVSNNIAEGFERSTKKELLSFVSIARGSSGEVRSIIATIRNRPKVQPHLRSLEQISLSADSCARQLAAWAGSIDALPFEGQRHMPAMKKRESKAAEAAHAFRLRFLQNLKPSHPLYNSAEAQEARRQAQP